MVMTVAVVMTMIMMMTVAVMMAMVITPAAPVAGHHAFFEPLHLEPSGLSCDDH